MRRPSSSAAGAGRIVAASPIYRSDPVGVTDQPPFLNAVAALDTELDPDALLDVLLDIEAAHGRVREVRWGPRTLDLDLIWFEDVARDDARLTLPHPRAHEREFVLRPLCDIAPDLRSPAGRRASGSTRSTRRASSGRAGFPSCSAARPPMIGV